MSVILIEVARGIRIAFAISAITFIYARFWRRPSDNPVPLLWVIHWTTLLLSTVLLFAWDVFTPWSAWPAAARLVAVQLGIVLDFVGNCALVLLAESLPISVAIPSRRTIRSVIWLVSVSLLLLYVTQLALMPGTADVIGSYIGYFAILWFASRWVAMMAPRPSMYVAFPLFLYASLNIFFIGRYPSREVFAVMYTFAVLLYGALLYAGYYTLALSPNESGARLPSSTPASSVRQGSPVRTRAMQTPTPRVEVRLENFFGFLYLLWTYPSGRGAVLTLLALTITFVLAVIGIVFKR